MPGRASTKRMAISFDIKKEVIAQKEKEEVITAIGRDLGLSESSVRIIRHKRDKIHASIKAYGTSKLDSRKQAPDSKVIKMEWYLNAWISKKECEEMALNKWQIMEMAKEFYLTNFDDRSTNCCFPYRLHASYRMISHRTTSSIDPLNVLYQTKVYTLECQKRVRRWDGRQSCSLYSVGYWWEGSEALIWILYT